MKNKKKTIVILVLICMAVACSGDNELSDAWWGLPAKDMTNGNLLILMIIYLLFK